MAATKDIVEAARAAIGPVGAKIPSIGISTITPFDVQRAGLRRLEAAGFGAAWNGEGVGAKDAFVELAVLLAATERMAFSSAIANMYARPAPTTHGAATMLADAFPGRFLLGLGGGYPFQAAQAGQQIAPPIARTREYFANMALEQPILEVPPVNYATTFAANGPKMLALAGELFDGAQPTMVPPSFVTNAREVLGPDKLIVVGLMVVPNADADAAKAIAKQIIAGVASFPGSPYAANLVRLGYSMEELAGGADRVVDDIVAYGSPDAIAATVRRFLDAGADHVIATAIVPDFETCIDQLVGVAPALTDLH